MNKPLIGLAPMAGFTDRTMRALCCRMGADYTCTEMVSAIGWMNARENAPVYHYLLSTAPEEANTAIQLFGKDPVLLQEAAARATELYRFTSIDLNMGCPARKVTTAGEGSALMKTPDLAIRLMEAVKAGTHLPVTLKMRLGYDANSLTALTLAQAAQDIGLAWVCIHGRTREQMFAGQADRAAVAAIKRQVRIPVLYNGDVTSAESALEALAETSCDGLLIGRAAMGNPWLFSEIADATAGKPVQSPTNAQRLMMMEEHIDRMVAFKGEHIAMLQMRAHIGHYIHGLHGAAEVRRQLNTVSTTAEQKAMLRRMLTKENP
ncbi:MAG TPA: tRNA dihydrouridine synthase DusB [Candidatus Limiplasma sp.]|nr:tRNA dihydrouridine synthase DusB [Candidatus Limiplasma sp.]